MSKRRLIKKSSILKLKYSLEERETVEEENKVGDLEFNEILKEFSQRVNPSQKKHFDQTFFGTENPNERSKNQSTTTDITTQAASKISKEGESKSKNLPAWAKSLYKKIVQRSHPDRYIGFPIQEIKEKFTTVYINAVSAFEQEDIGMLLLCAYDVEIDISEIPESEAFIASSIKNHQQRISEISNLIGYQWYHLSEKNRLMFLKNYLFQLGYKFDSEKAKDVIEKNKKSRISRKTGTRPEKIRVNKGKIK